jgi:hypothetical protein
MSEDAVSAYVKVLVNSVPKSGTNLVASVLDLFPSMKFRKVTLNRRMKWHPLNVLAPPRSPRCLVGIDQDVPVTERALRFQLARISPGQYSSAHVPYSSTVDKIACSLGIKVIIPVRDPRDLVVSWLHHVLSRKNHYLHERVSAIPTRREQLLAVLRGVSDEQGNQISSSLGMQLATITGWFEPTAATDVLAVMFEDLVGAQGGGSDDRRDRAVRAIGTFLGIGLTERQASAIGADAFGQGSTFRAGQIGSWRAEYGSDQEVLHQLEVTCKAHMERWGY